MEVIVKAIREIKKIKNNKVIITLPPGFSDDEVEILIIAKESHNDYQLGDLVGKLKWQGDSVKAVREIRNEWR